MKQPTETTAQAEARCSKYKNANAAYNKARTEMFRSVIRTNLATW